MDELMAVSRSDGQLRSGIVLDTAADGSVRVALGTEPGPAIPCTVSPDRRGAPSWRPGDEVLIWLRPTGQGVVLATLSGSAPAESDVPESLVLEARHDLTLRVGDGSITIREDGKILIKGRDLVSHAQRANRIRGGSVSIN